MHHGQTITTLGQFLASHLTHADADKRSIVCSLRSLLFDSLAAQDQALGITQTFMRYTILHMGVPIGDVDLDLANDPAVGVVHPLAAYSSIRDRVRSATKAFNATAFGLGDNEPTSSVALADGAALGRELELRDDRQDLVKVDFVELADWEGKPLDVTVWVRARHALSGVPSIRPDSTRTNHGSSRSDA